MSIAFPVAQEPARHRRFEISIAKLIALLLPLALLGGALASQYVGGLFPCEMCMWQRWPHVAALSIAALTLIPAVPFKRALVILAALFIAASGVIGIFHAGVEWHWWQGITACATTFNGAGLSSDALLKQIMAAPLISCDVAQWRFLGISLAGCNAVLSLGGAATIAALLRPKRAHT